LEQLVGIKLWCLHNDMKNDLQSDMKK